MADSPETQDRRGLTRLIVGAILVVVVLAFVFDNTRSVKVGFVVGDHETRLIYVLILTLAIGIVLGWLYGRHTRKN
jgi:uncharacterized integral membrane protein